MKGIVTGATKTKEGEKMHHFQVGEEVEILNTETFVFQDGSVTVHHCQNGEGLRQLLADEDVMFLD